MLNTQQNIKIIRGKDIEPKIKLKHAAKHHVDSFNFAIDTLLLKRLPQYLDQVHIDTPPDSQIHPFHHLSFRFTKFQIGKPEIKQQCAFINDSHKLYPVQCRQRRLTYSSLLQAYIERTTDNITTDTFKVKLGYIPIMVGSNHCHLNKLNGKELIKAHQDPTQFGGYFLINGIQRIVRMLIAQKKNYPIAFTRGGFIKRGNNFSEYAVSMRCVRSGDLFAQTITLHYLNDGSVILRLIIQKAEYLIPLGVILKALGGRNISSRKGDSEDIYGEVTDLQIFKSIVTPYIDSDLDTQEAESQNQSQQISFIQQMSEKVQSFLSQHRNLGLSSGRQCRQYLGSRFRIMMSYVDGLDLADQEVGALFIKNHICVHAQKFSEKLNILCIMVQKLYCFYNGSVGPDNLDALSTHQCLLSGHIYFMLMREKLGQILLGVKSRVIRELLGTSNQKRSKKNEDLSHFVQQQENRQKEELRQRKKNVKMSQEKITASTAKLRSKQFLIQAFDSQGKMFANKINYFLATGNLISKTNLDLQQTAGFTVVADKLNSIRYLSHFRSIHRGHYFTEMKTTQVRKLLPESWGFLCPVHTPDGAPCGLLNHISMACYPIAKQDYNVQEQLQQVNQLQQIGQNFSKSSQNEIQSKRVRQIKSPQQFKALISYLLKPSLNQNRCKGIPVILDGVLLYYVPSSLSPYLANALRLLKSSNQSSNIPFCIPIHTQITYIPLPSSHSLKSPLFPGIFISTSISRFLRPVRNLISGNVQWISPLQQITLPIACLQQDIRPDVTHQQLSPNIILSIVASTTPFSDFNQSPRNMYQCQMAKQTMGTSTHNLKYRADNKSYRIMTPQLPIVRTDAYEEWDFSQHPSGTNAVVAVISYTGYDMEDAMIINKMAYERGFGHGCVYKTNTRRLNQGGRGGLSQGIGGDGGLQFRLIESDADRKMMEDAIVSNRLLQESGQSARQILDQDGLPRVGALLKYMSPQMCVIDTVNMKAHIFYYKQNEEARVERVKVSNPMNQDSRQSVLNDYQVQITLRVKRNPIIGDKFSSRHGQKGVLGMLWPQQDMPFTSQGIVPDIIINPHAFPSRMTIGMLIESMAAKSGALHGRNQTFSTFDRYQGDSAVSHFGKQLVKAGYQYHGNEEMYCGTTGELMQTEIFIGVVYYQRLRHMVSDKAQARSTGPVDPLTRQPVKGRKHHGGIRFGEMERDSLMAHGVSASLHDRLMVCSDYSQGYVCERCGSILSCYQQVMLNRGGNQGRQTQREQPSSSSKKWNLEQKVMCRVCGMDGRCAKVRMPFVLRYLANQLGAMNIKMSFKLR